MNYIPGTLVGIAGALAGSSGVLTGEELAPAATAAQPAAFLEAAAIFAFSSGDDLAASRSACKVLRLALSLAKVADNVAFSARAAPFIFSERAQNLVTKSSYALIFEPKSPSATGASGYLTSSLTSFTSGFGSSFFPQNAKETETNTNTILSVIFFVMKFSPIFERLVFKICHDNSFLVS